MNPVAIYAAEPAEGWLPWGAFAPFLCVVLVVAPIAATSPALEHFGLVDANGDPVGRIGLVAFLLITFGMLGFVVLGWIRFVEKRPLSTVGLVRGNGTRTFLTGYAVGLTMVIVLVAAIWLAGAYEVGAAGKAFRSLAALASIGVLLLGFALQSSIEEFVFRGWLLSAIARKFNIVLAVALTSIVFTFLHYESGQAWLDTLNIFLFSVFVCAWAIRAGNIWGVMGWHAAWNWLLAVGFEVPITGINANVPALLIKLIPVGPEYLTGGAPGPEGSLCCTFLVIGATLLCLLRRPAQS
jgi:membrane protease YdiL (CAAX protease family)